MTTTNWDFVYAHEKDSVTDLMLQKHLYPEVDMAWAVTQIEARQKAMDKLPTWYKTHGIAFPTRVSVEQSSSETTAMFKAGLFRGEKMIDLTGGLGVDAFCFAKSFKKVIYCEQNPALCQIALNNKKVLGLENVHVKQGDGFGILKTADDDFDLIYLDPARRDSNNNKVFLLKDCQPNVLDNIDLLLTKAKQVLIKTSPMLDIPLVLKQLVSVSHIWVISVGNEVKEILFSLTRNKTADLAISAIIITKNSVEKYAYALAKTATGLAFGFPQQYVYEPNVAILKAGLQDRIGVDYHLSKLHPNSHLYTSMQWHAAYPGRVFKIESVFSLNKKQLIKEVPSRKANITVRNFPMDVAAIRKKTGLKEGGETYLFATTLKDDRKVLIKCRK